MTIDSTSQSTIMKKTDDRPQQDNARLIGLLSMDVMYLILRNLSSRDLLRCAITCKEWCEMLISWPHFWETLDEEMIVFPSQHNLITRILRHEENVHSIQMPPLPRFAEEYWYLLVEMRQHDIAELEFNELEFRNHQGIRIVLEAAGSNLQELIFKNCNNIPISELIGGTWLEPCKEIRQFSLPRSWTWPENTTGPAFPKDLSFATLPLIHLHISAGPSATHLIPHLLRRCPKLESLALDVDDPIDDHGKILNIAFSACPNLQWIAMVPCASARTPFFNEILEGEDYSDDGLYGLFLGGKHLRLNNPDDLYPLLEKSHKTLRVLHLVYDGTPIFWNTLYHLGKLGVPKLRELSLNSLDGCAFHTHRSSPTFEHDGNIFSFEQIFIQLVKRAPSLQVAHFDGDGGNIPPELRLTEACFTELGRRQHQLKRLFATYCCDINALHGYCRMPSTQLEHLSCDCGVLNGEDLRHLLKKATKFHKFETLHVSTKDFYDPNFDRVTMNFRLRSFFEGYNNKCDCMDQNSFTQKDREYGKEVIRRRYGVYNSNAMPDMATSVDRQ